MFLFRLSFINCSGLGLTDFSISSVAQSCPILCDPMDCSMLGFPGHHQLLELEQTHVHRVADVIQLSHPLLCPFPPACNLSQHQGLFQWVSSFLAFRSLHKKTLMNDFLGGPMVKNLPALVEDTRDAISIPASERYPWEGNGNPF